MPEQVHLTIEAQLLRIYDLKTACLGCCFDRGVIHQLAPQVRSSTEKYAAVTADITLYRSIGAARDLAYDRQELPGRRTEVVPTETPLHFLVARGVMQARRVPQPADPHRGKGGDLDEFDSRTDHHLDASPDAFGHLRVHQHGYRGQTARQIGCNIAGQKFQHPIAEGTAVGAEQRKCLVNLDAGRIILWGKHPCRIAGSMENRRVNIEFTGEQLALVRLVIEKNEAIDVDSSGAPPHSRIIHGGDIRRARNML